MIVSKLLICVGSAVLLLTASSHSSADVSITGADQTPGTVATQLPGSPTDFYFFTSSSQSVLNDFSESDAAGTLQYGPYSDFNAPTGTATPAGIIFQHPDPNVLVNLATFTLGTSTTFNYSDFNVFVLYDDTTTDPNSIDAAISLASGADATGATATVVSVTDPTDKSTPNVGRIVEFNVQGLAAGDELTFGASAATPIQGVNGNPTAYLGAVSFESAPEPSTTALLIGGLAVLGLALRNFRRFSNLRA